MSDHGLEDTTPVGQKDAVNDDTAGGCGAAVTDARAALDAATSEAQLQQAVIEAAQRLGWRVCHFRPARTADGWRTPVEADGAGWPDLVLVRERIIYVELKSEHGRLTAAQVEWLEALADAGGEAYLWAPHNWSSGEIERCLR